MPDYGKPFLGLPKLWLLTMNLTQSLRASSATAGTPGRSFEVQATKTSKLLYCRYRRGDIIDEIRMRKKGDSSALDGVTRLSHPKFIDLEIKKSDCFEFRIKFLSPLPVLIC